MTRTFIEPLSNGVTIETQITSGLRTATKEVILAVKYNGHTLFKKTLKNRSPRHVATVVRERDKIAVNASTIVCNHVTMQQYDGIRFVACPKCLKLMRQTHGV